MRIKINKDELVGTAVLAVLGVLVFYAWPAVSLPQSQPNFNIHNETIPQIIWGDLGVKMVEAGAIDQEKFLALYDNSPLLQEEAGRLIGSYEGNLKITPENSGLVLNLLWAYGLGNKNEILDSGPMTKYGDPGGFASTGGWTLAQGEAMEHYSRHGFTTLNNKEQSLVDRVSRNIYRPCCNNPVHFPDCNHGMAMLGLLELLSAQGFSEEEMYRIALQVNSYWFPDTYETISRYLEIKGTTLGAYDPKEILGYEYSSAAGYNRILTQVTPPENQPGGSCGVQ
ncbi:MAG: hypothetical protein A3F99_01815 [Candidatus Colwellbacteria bacterium RIFCSPLOWO2_12_FULL_43_11]|uniref:Uncharacterized protein n=1 Tax=Candidatus Colwellbacteria bacterium RIFCSPLOWO2_12_FULL_43_11 TaxID=1797693 RepID=A0A1G1Z9C7_9BACT|nr:MAG: hypothetical protein A3F99_01815 [Candidatus Colwellbacteria bacterium RIFCSPLOWO2_12_FULL_43_11]